MLRPSARAEVQAFVGLLPAISSSWTRDWCSCIVATDASEYGLGVCLKECEKNRLSDQSDGPVSGLVSENVAPTTSVHAQLSLNTIDSGLTFMVT